MTEYDVSGKTLIPFNTNGGYGVGSSFDDVRKLAPDAEILPGFSIKGGLEDEILAEVELRHNKVIDLYRNLLDQAPIASVGALLENVLQQQQHELEQMMRGPAQQKHAP